jgi:putative ABC transport system permease protein
MWNGNLKSAFASLRGNKWRSFFTMLGIIIGVTSVVTIVSLGEGLKHQIVGQVHDLGTDIVTVRPGRLVTERDSGKSNINLLALLTISTLTPEDVDSISKLPSVKAAVPMDFVTNTVRSDGKQLDNVFVAGTGAEMVDILNSKVDYGVFFDAQDSTQNFAVIGQEVALRLYGQLNAIGQTININGQDFIVHGVLEPSSTGILSVAQADFNYAVLIPFQPALDLAGGKANILQILVKSDRPEDVDKTISQINQVLGKNHAQQDYSVLKQSDLVDAAGSAVDAATGFITAIAAISLLVGGIGIMDIMLVSISERNREIGVRKAIGATNRQIMSQFFIEGLLLTIGGGIIGLAIAFLINLMLRLYTTWQPVITLPVVAISIGFSILVGVVFSTIPALKAARKDPINALRGD